MAELETKWPTLLDFAKALDTDNNVAQVAEVLTQTNEILMDMVFTEGNLPTGHRTTVRAGLPSVTWRQLYGGVQPSKSKRATVTDSCGMLEAYAEVDKALADLNGNTMAWRSSEDQAFIEAMSQEMALATFTANDQIDPEKFMGFAPRFNDKSAANGEHIIDGGGTGSDNASIWLIGWGENTVHGIFPRGSQAGLQMTDKGQVTIENVDGNNGRMEGYRTHYRWDMGLVVRDWRYVVRIANIDRSALSADPASGGANLPQLMFQALELPPALSNARFSFYMDRTVRTKFRQQLAASVKNSTLTTETVGGVRATMWEEIPLRRVDALAADEARVV